MQKSTEKSNDWEDSRTRFLSLLKLVTCLYFSAMWLKSRRRLWHNLHCRAVPTERIVSDWMIRRVMGSDSMSSINRVEQKPWCYMRNGGYGVTCSHCFISDMPACIESNEILSSFLFFHNFCVLSCSSRQARSRESLPPPPTNLCISRNQGRRTCTKWWAHTPRNWDIEKIKMKKLNVINK